MQLSTFATLSEVERISHCTAGHFREWTHFGHRTRRLAPDFSPVKSDLGRPKGDCVAAKATSANQPVQCSPQLDLAASSMIGSVGSGPTIVQLFCGLGVSVEGRYEAVETWARMGFRRGPAVNARTRDAGDDHEYRCRTRPLLVGPYQGQPNGPGGIPPPARRRRLFAVGSSLGCHVPVDRGHRRLPSAAARR